MARRVAVRTLCMLAALLGALHVDDLSNDLSYDLGGADAALVVSRRRLRHTACPPTLSFCKSEKARKQTELEARATAEEARKVQLKDKAENDGQVRAAAGGLVSY